MAGRAIVMPSQILSMEYDQGNLSSTFTVHYVMDGVSEELKDVTMQCPWPTDATGLANVHKAYRDTVILQQPIDPEYDLAPGDVLIPQFQLGSLM